MKISRVTTRIEEVRDGKAARPLVSIEDLIALIGEQNTVELCRAYEGARIPFLLAFLQRKRRKAIIARYLRGDDIASLSCFYRLSPIAVRRIVRPYRAARRAQALAARNPPPVPRLVPLG